MIKLRNIHAYLYTYNLIHTPICKLRNINNAKSYGFTKEKKYVQYDSCKSTGHTLEEVQRI